MNLYAQNLSDNGCCIGALIVGHMDLNTSESMILFTRNDNSYMLQSVHLGCISFLLSIDKMFRTQNHVYSINIYVVLMYVATRVHETFNLCRRH